VDDIELPGLAHLAFVRSPEAHARVTALQIPEDAAGLIAVLTSQDLEGWAEALPIQAPDGAVTRDEPHPVLAGEVVRYAGEPVAAVVAESRALAEDAAELVEVDFEPLEVVVDPERSQSTMVHWSGEGGDVEGAFAAADEVVSGRYAMPRLAAVPMETRGAVASYSAGDDLLTIWCSAQDTHRQLKQLAAVLGRAAESIRVVIPDVGGAFGSKGSLAPEAAVAAVAAMLLGRPVKWTEDRFENFVGAYQGRGVQADIELALTSGGRMLALRAHIVADLGAYLLPTTAIPPHTTGMLMTGCYDIAAARVDVDGMRTNKVPTGPYRGAGRPEAAYFVESVVDDAARRLGMDPVELRRRNLVSRFPHPSPLGWTYDSGDYRRCLDLAVELAGPQPQPNGDRLGGRGVAMYVERAGGQFESARAALDPDGSVSIASSTSPHGQGHDTTFAQIAAERLQVEPERVKLSFSDSAVSPPGIGTFASRSVAMGGSAVALAAEALVDRCRRAAAELWSLATEDLSWDAGGVLSANGRSLSLGELAAVAPGLEAEARFESDLVFSSGAYAADVEIERATGRLTIKRVVAVDDAGTIVNPLLAEGQVLGGTAQGLGQCLVEEVVYNEEGQPTTASFAQYSLLTAAEMPPIATAFVESPTPLNPLGAKGIGEGGAIGTPAAVGNAVADSLGGRRLDPPYTEEKLWRAIEESDGR
jgi:aerobic carbon-monoxide dehydrogenase large subunit